MSIESMIFLFQSINIKDLGKGENGFLTKSDVEKVKRMYKNKIKGKQSD